MIKQLKLKQCSNIKICNCYDDLNWGPCRVDHRCLNKTFLKKCIDCGSIRRSLIYKIKKPKTKDKYLGIEIECFTRHLDNLIDYLIYYNLDEYCQVSDDGSIQEEFGEPLELKFLVKESEYKKVLMKICKILQITKCGVNESCGLHVHLDMRSRNKQRVFKSLIKNMFTLYAINPEERLVNAYCQPNNLEKKNYKHHSKYSGINSGTAYKNHKTFEVRIHRGTTEYKDIINWIGICVAIVNNKRFDNDMNKYISSKKKEYGFKDIDMKSLIKGIAIGKELEDNGY